MRNNRGQRPFRHDTNFATHEQSEGAKPKGILREYIVYRLHAMFLAKLQGSVQDFVSTTFLPLKPAQGLDRKSVV